MDDKLQGLLEKIRLLEHELIAEIQKKEQEFFYEIHEKKIRFEKEIKKQHKELVKKIHRFLYDAAFLNILTAPVVWSCLIPAALMDLVLSVFQAICFPIYGIPRVRRGDYIVLDRRYLSYLNLIEKMNCFYCGYFNGVVGYVREIAGRTEQYWCPIKHARKIKSIHSRYKNFFDYGDGKGYRKRIEEVRRSFKDLSSEKEIKKG
ncbi:MAG: hypothetical protein V3U37_04160 [Nitrospinaceae bacterium]